MSKTSWWDDVDDLFNMIDADDKSSGKKKKKKGKKKKDSVSLAPVPTMDSFKRAKKTLKGMTKSELLSRMDSLGIALDGVDVKSKKSMKNAIAQHMSGGTYVGKHIASDKVPVGLSAAEHEAKVKAMKDRPPYYIDEDTQDFIIPNCVQTSDMNCFNGMMSLGAYRRNKRQDDAFGELMYRLSKKLSELPDSTPSEIIDVTDFSVHDVEDVPDSLPSELVPKKHQLPAVYGEPVTEEKFPESFGKRELNGELPPGTPMQMSKKNRKKKP